jgi:hypothetical protein
MLFTFTVPSSGGFHGTLYSTLLLKINIKNLRNKKMKSIRDKHFVEQKNEARKPNRNSSLRRLEFFSQRHPLKIRIKNSFSDVSESSTKWICGNWGLYCFHTQSVTALISTHCSVESYFLYIYLATLKNKHPHSAKNKDTSGVVHKGDEIGALCTLNAFF